MDLIKSIITSLVSTFWYLIPIFIIICIIKSSWFKGFIGEQIVNLSIKLLLDGKVYTLIKNVTLPIEDGTTQIDHILVSKFGIFVIETKNMKGWIFGSKHQKQWTQQIFKHRNKFQNPLHQNYKHTLALAACLNTEDSKIFSVITFVGDSQFKTVMPENVTSASGLIRYIKSKQSILLSDSEQRDLINKIGTGRLKPSMKTHRKHVQHVKEIQENKKIRNPALNAQAQWYCVHQKKTLMSVTSFGAVANILSVEQPALLIAANNR